MIPGAPMRGAHIDALVRFRVDPSAERAAAGKNECVRAVLVDHGEFQVFVEGGAGHGLPHRPENYTRGSVAL